MNHPYQQAGSPLPAQILSWPFYGAGLENLGVAGQPILEPLPTCGPDEILVRVDALGLCASDAKMVRLGRQYPLFFERDFAQNPARLGHEAALTVIQVGAAWQKQYQSGQRLGIQPDVYLAGQRAIFGVNIPGAMTQYLTLDRRVLAGDEGSYVFPVPPELSYADVALLEPWACVEVAYSPTARRLEPKPGGVMWLKGRPGDMSAYRMNCFLPSRRVVLTDVPPGLAAWAQPVEVIEDNSPYEPNRLAELTDGLGFDDIILLDPRQAEVVAAAIESLAPHGSLNLVTAQPLDGPVAVDMGRLHYQHLALLGCPGPDIAQAYGQMRNRSELRPDGVTWLVGAGGTMGRMNLQRLLEMPNGPRAIIATNRGQARLASLKQDFGPLAKAKGVELVAVSPTAEPDRLEAEIERLTAGRGCDDIVVVVPDSGAVELALPHLAFDGMLVMFAGVPTGHKVALPLDWVALHQAQFTGTSGSKVADQQRIIQKTQAGLLSPARAVAAIGGMRAMNQGLRAVMEQTYPGKVVIYSQLLDLPLLSLPELETALPPVFARLGSGSSWTAQAEQALFEHYL
jgi:threonine dehydrogenase-like Zn-dependent dehydrogenase